MSGKVSGAKVTQEFKVKQMKQYMTELEAKALREAGNYVRREYRKKVYDVVKKRTGKLKKSVNVKLKGKLKKVQVGFAGKAFYGRFFEQGKLQRGADGIMRDIVRNDVKGIRAIIENNLKGVQLTEEQIKQIVQYGALTEEAGDE